MTKAATAVVLAAGASRRFGQPKQLALIDGRPMLDIVVEAAHHSRCITTITVLGAEAEAVLNHASLAGTQVIFNRDWATGIAGSIKTAVEFVQKGQMRTDALLFLVGDQPFVSPTLIDTIVQRFETASSPLVCCRYQNTVGVPALFASPLWDELSKLTGDTGAKQVIKRWLNECSIVDFPSGAVDIDTTEQYFSLLQSQAATSAMSSFRSGGTR